MRKFVWIIEMVDLNVPHSCRGLIESVHETEDGARKRMAELNKEDSGASPELQYELQRKILHP